MSRQVVPSISVNAHVRRGTGLEHNVYPARKDSGPYVVLVVGDYSGGVDLFVHDLDVLDALGDVVEKARQDLANELGLLPSGEPCAYVDAFGSIEWNEHDHDACLETLVDEPVPYVPAESVPAAGTAWERHDDPTVEDNPLDDDADDWEDEEDDDRDDDGLFESRGSRILHAEGWL